MRDCGRIIGFGIELVVVKDYCGRDGNVLLSLKAAGLQEEEEEEVCLMYCGKGKATTVPIG